MTVVPRWMPSTTNHTRTVSAPRGPETGKVADGVRGRPKGSGGKFCFGKRTTWSGCQVLKRAGEDSYLLRAIVLEPLTNQEDVRMDPPSRRGTILASLDSEDDRRRTQ